MRPYYERNAVTNDELLTKAKEQILKNRLKLARATAVTATVVAAYYIGKSRGVVVHLYPSDPRNGPVSPIGSLKF